MELSPPKSSQGDENQTPLPDRLHPRLPAQEQGLAIYVASRASVPERGEMWRKFRADGFRIVSTWIDEDGAGESESLTDLWQRIADEVGYAYGLVLYAEAGDFPLKGALIEVGIALGLNKPVVVCLPNVTLDPRSCRPIGSWINHPLVSRNDDIEAALMAVRNGEAW